MNGNNMNGMNEMNGNSMNQLVPYLEPESDSSDYDENAAEQLDAHLMGDRRAQKGRKNEVYKKQTHIKTAGRKRDVAPRAYDTPAIKKLEGEANLHYLQGEYKECINSIMKILAETGKTHVSRDMIQLLAECHEHLGNVKEYLQAKYHCLTNLGGLGVEDFESVIKEFHEKGPGTGLDVPRYILLLCRKCHRQRIATMEIYTTLGQILEYKYQDPKGAYEVGYLWCFKKALNFRMKVEHKSAAAKARAQAKAKAAGQLVEDSGKILVDSAAIDAARALFKLKRWDECCKILDLCVARSLELNSTVQSKVLTLFGEVVCLRLREYRRCADLFLASWELGRTGDAARDAALIIGPGTSVRRGFGRKDLLPLSWFATALIYLDRFDEVDETGEYPRGTREAECMLCVEAVNSIVDRVDIPKLNVKEGTITDTTKKTFEETILHTLADALIQKKKADAAKRILKKFTVAKNVSAATRYRMGKCAYLDGHYDKAIEMLEPLMKDDKKKRDADDDDEEDAEGGLRQAAINNLLARLYILTKETKKLKDVIGRMKYKETRILRHLPPALSRAERDNLFRDLKAELQVAWNYKTGVATDRGLFGGSSSSTAIAYYNETMPSSPRSKRQRRGTKDSNYGDSIHSLVLPETFNARFTHLVQDCELDYERANQAKGIDLMSKGKAQTQMTEQVFANRRKNYKAISKSEDANKADARERQRYLSLTQKKKALALESIEDIYGGKLWFEFVRFGCEFGLAQVLEQPGEAMDLLEMVIHNRHKFKGRSRTETSRGLMKLQRSSLNLALQSGYTKIAFKHIRSFAITVNFQGTKYSEERVDEKMIALLGRLMATSELSYEYVRPVVGVASVTEGSTDMYNNEGTTSGVTSEVNPGLGVTIGHLTVSDYQKWASRHLCENPASFSLMMIVGHCSALSGRVQFATKEYARAIAQCPLNSLAHLCLAASLVSLSMSRIVTQRHKEVQNALVALRKYQDLRKHEKDGDESVPNKKKTIVLRADSPSKGNSVQQAVSSSGNALQKSTSSAKAGGVASAKAGSAASAKSGAKASDTKSGTSKASGTKAGKAMKDELKDENLTIDLKDDRKITIPKSAIGCVTEQPGLTREAETWYNVGRGHHQLGIVKTALQCYQRCMDKLDEDLAEYYPGVPLGELQHLEFPSHRTDKITLRRVCAWNLQQIFSASGNFEKAQQVVMQHMVIV